MQLKRDDERPAKKKGIRVEGELRVATGERIMECGIFRSSRTLRFDNVIFDSTKIEVSMVDKGTREINLPQ